VRAQVMGEVERQGVAKSQLHILAGLTKLRQAACDPRLLGLPREFSHDDSGKLMALRELVDEAESGGHKVLVFSQFVTMLKLVRETRSTRTRSATSTSTAAPSIAPNASSASKMTDRVGLLDQPESRWFWAESHSADTGSLRPLVEPGRRRPSLRSRASHRPKRR